MLVPEFALSVQLLAVLLSGAQSLAVGDDGWTLGVGNILRDILHQLLIYSVPLNICSSYFPWQTGDRGRMWEKVDNRCSQSFLKAGG